MDNFLHLYDEYLEKILYAVNNYSGKHSINKEKAEEWINSQPFPEAQAAARNIIKHTKYITLKEVYADIENMVKNEYKTLVEINENLEKKIVMIVGKPEKSFFFISVLAVYFMKKHNLRIPHEFKFEFTDFILNKTDVIINFDDMSYSGSQLRQFLDKSIEYNFFCELYNIVSSKNETLQNDDVKTHLKRSKETIENSSFRKSVNTFIPSLMLCFNYFGYSNREEIITELKTLLKNIQFPNINIFLISLTNKSLKKLSYFKKYMEQYYLLSTPLGDKLKYIEYINPFKITYSKKIDLVCEILSEKEMFNIAYYFTIFNMPNVFCYFDFKIADQPSTISTVLNYGPIVPSNFELISYFPYITDYKKSIEKIQNMALFGNFQLSTENFSNLDGYQKYLYLIYKYYLKDIKILKEDFVFEYNSPIKFCPFLNNCYNLKKILNNNIMNNLNYLLLNYEALDDADFEDIHQHIFYDDSNFKALNKNNLKEIFFYDFFDIDSVNKFSDKLKFVIYLLYNKYVKDTKDNNPDINNDNIIKLLIEQSSIIEKESKETIIFLEEFHNQKCGLSFYKNPDYKITYDETLSANINGGRKNMTMKKHKIKRTPKKKYKTNITKRFCKLKKSKKCNILYKKYKKNTI